jgi:hypothetical protein
MSQSASDLYEIKAALRAAQPAGGADNRPSIGTAFLAVRDVPRPVSDWFIDTSTPYFRVKAKLKRPLELCGEATGSACLATYVTRLACAGSVAASATDLRSTWMLGQSHVRRGWRVVGKGPSG